MVPQRFLTLAMFRVLGLIIMFFITLPTNLFSQKLLIDKNAIENWSRISNVEITDDGKYTFYTSTSGKDRLLTIQSTESKWRRRIPNADNPSICGDSKFICFALKGDTIAFLSLGDDKVNYIADVHGLKVSAKGARNWVSWWRKNNELELYNLETKKSIQYSQTRSLVFSNNGDVAILVRQPDDKNYAIEWIDLTSGKSFAIWTGISYPRNVIWDKSESKIAFLTSDSTNDKMASHVYIASRNDVKSFPNNNTKGLNYRCPLGRISLINFDDGGERIYFLLENSQSIPNSGVGVKVDIWHYSDKEVQAEQLSQLQSEPENLISVLYINENIINIFKAEGHERIITKNNGNIELNGNYFIINTYAQKPDEQQFLKMADGKSSISLICIKTGVRQVVLKDRFVDNVCLSPDEKYLVYFDRKAKQYFSYNLDKKNVRIISRDIPYSLYNEMASEEHAPIPVFADAQIAGWFSKGETVMLYDRYDIWGVDLEGIRKPVNLSRNYGRKHRIVLRNQLLQFTNEEKRSVSFGDTLLLHGITDKYDEGYYYLLLNKRSKIIKLSSEPFRYYIREKVGLNYLLERQNWSSAPNWFCTKDFKEYKQLTALEPQQSYNWSSAELMQWRMFDGNLSQGILYKPQYFDSTKKYPIIFTFYQKMASTINSFIEPVFSSGAIEIPWYTSRGYLVFVPDIYYKYGKPGESAYNSVVSAAQYFKKIKWVDSKCMGINGASFGGFEVNYIVTRTNIFAAAVPAFGAVDLISMYGSFRGKDGKEGPYQWLTETGQLRIGFTLWDNKFLYIQNSPIFRADKVVTPILIVHNKEDYSVPWSQGVEWFMALRRLGKRVWMLQYDGEGHGVHQKVNQLDYTIRTQQFFDYYLKHLPPAKWMTEGVPAKFKSIESGYELDQTGKIP